MAQNTILIIGDSLSAGYGIDVSKGWVALLQQRLKQENYPYKVINSSISGDTTSNGLSRLKAVLPQVKPHITIIELGANDGLRGLQIDTIKANLQQMITLAKQAGNKVLLLGIRLPPNYGPIYTQQFQQMYHDLATQEGVALVPLFLTNVDEHVELMQADRLHPSVKAQLIILDNIWPELKKLL